MYRLSAIELREKIISKEIRIHDALDSYYSHIERNDGQIGAYLLLQKEQAYARADELEKKLMAGEEPGLLFGVPIAIKDNLNVKGSPTTCASKILEGYVSPYNATVIDRLLDEDAIFLGKTNMDEFAMGSSTETSFYKTTHNPWNLDCIPGGSSGGSAAAVSAFEAPISLGSDTGGSIRQPAAMCGVAGLKSTYGTVSRYGLVAFASSLDQIGPFARNIKDTAIALQAISGHDEKDSTSIKGYTFSAENVINGKFDASEIKIGVPAEIYSEGLSPEVKDIFEQAVKVYKDLGAEIMEVKLPNMKYAVAVYYLLATAEASSNLARFDGVKYGYRAPNAESLIEMYKKTRGEGFGAEVKRRIMLGTYALSSGYYDAYYLKALKVRRLIADDFKKAFEKCDVIALPTSPTLPFKLGEKMDDPLAMYLSDIYTISLNLAGLPGISMNGGFSKDKLPVGIQLISNYMQEEFLLKTADAFERNTDFNNKIPTFVKTN